MDSEKKDPTKDVSKLPDFSKAADEWEINHQKMVSRDRELMTRGQFDSKYQGTQDYGPDKPVPKVDPAKRLDNAGFKRDIAGEDFDLLCRAYDVVYGMSSMGLLLTGGVGSGKTFGITSLVKGSLIRLTDREDFLSLEPGLNSDSGRIEWNYVYGERNVILDDLGNEPVKSEYGVKVDVVADFILKWYTVKIEQGKPGRLFATTNLTGEQLIERYGDRVTDRLFSMVCVVKMTGNSKRRKPIVIK